MGTRISHELGRPAMWFEIPDYATADAMWAL